MPNHNLYKLNDKIYLIDAFGETVTYILQNARLYTVNFMRVLLRAKVPYISNWGLEMLVMQLYDQSKSVAMEALSVISEACENEVRML